MADALLLPKTLYFLKSAKKKSVYFFLNFYQPAIRPLLCGRITQRGLILNILIAGSLVASALTILRVALDEEIFDAENALVFISAMLTTAAVSWLFNRETEKSLMCQTEKMLQFYRFAEFGKIAAGLFHDLINPLTAALLQIETVKKRCGDSAVNYQMEVDNIRNQINKARCLAEAAKKQIYCQPVNGPFFINDEILSAAETFSYKARRSNIEISVFLEDKVEIFGDRLKFYRVICNLMSNALDAYFENGNLISSANETNENSEKNKKIKISLARQNGCAIIHIEDRGRGIKEDLLPYIFNPLFTTKEFDQGAGLGLYVAKNILEEEFGGAIKIESREGKGTTCALAIPLKKNSAQK